MGEPQRNWDERYQTNDLPWDSGFRSRELARVLAERAMAPCRAVELGCGSGTNAVFLAEQGFDVTGIDLSPTAIDRAKERASLAGVNVRFLAADLLQFQEAVEPFDFLFDRGCFHCARKVDVSAYRTTLKYLSRPGSWYLLLTGNANEVTETEGPPRLTEQDIRQDLEDLFEIQEIREFHFEDAGGTEGPLGWSCFLIRREAGE